MSKDRGFDFAGKKSDAFKYWNMDATTLWLKD